MQTLTSSIQTNNELEALRQAYQQGARYIHRLPSGAIAVYRDNNQQWQRAMANRTDHPLTWDWTNDTIDTIHNQAMPFWLDDVGGKICAETEAASRAGTITLTFSLDEQNELIEPEVAFDMPTGYVLRALVLARQTIEDEQASLLGAETQKELIAV